MSDASSERRRFSRVAFDAATELVQGPCSWPVRLLDLSLKGFTAAYDAVTAANDAADAAAKAAQPAEAAPAEGAAND